jgi:uncharacterized protein YyaL (SSP411 family)
MPNRLAHEPSPYLRQHADNPVDWYPWGAEAFAAARAGDKPILLSIGYSACHWCHVMAHESFEDPAIAAVMNERFVNVKVDREERPDVDAIYMDATQAMTGRGGWPMTVFLTPGGAPFYAGTYFPKGDAHGMPGFRRVLDAMDQVWRERREDAIQQADNLVGHMRSVAGLAASAGGGVEGPEGLSPAILRTAQAGMKARFDPRFGGFGPAPKFPQAMTIDFLVRAAALDPAPDTIEMITTSLDAMAAGGIYDHVGGGFARYSTDAIWLVPHFEKMLYDQALLVRAYLHAHLLLGEPRYRTVVEETITYVLRDLHHPDGGFYSAEDADSDGVEGRFYVWSRDEIEAVCGDDASAVIDFFGVTDTGNFEGANILFAVDRTATRPEAVTRALPKLFAAREERVRPGLDDKVLLGWNALFCRVLLEAAVGFDRADWLDAARANLEFLLRALRRRDGRLLRAWQTDTPEDADTGRARHLAYSEDYGALLELLVTFAELDDVDRLAEARTVADELLRLFSDPDAPGFFTTGRDAEALVVRPKDLEDNAVPAGNSLAVTGLLRLGALTGDARYEEAALASLAPLAPVAGEHGLGFAYLLDGVERAVYAPIEVAIVGDPGDDRTRALRREVTRRILPASVVVTAVAGSATHATPLLEDRGEVDGGPAAYVCERFACRRPVTTPLELRAELDAALAARRNGDAPDSR